MVDQDHASERSSTETIGRPDPAQHEMGKVVADKQNKSRFGFGLNNGVEKVDEPSRPDGKHELQDYEAPEVLGYAYSSRKKWTILSVIFIVQCSMNFNASIYANGVDFLTEKFSISAQAARVGQMIFLVAYAFGCELWAPWSEELGRKPILQASLFLVNSESLTSGSGATVLMSSLANPSRARPQLWFGCRRPTPRRSVLSRRLGHAGHGRVVTCLSV